MSDDHCHPHENGSAARNGQSTRRSDASTHDDTRRAVLKRTALFGAGLTGLGASAVAPGSAQTESLPVERLDGPDARRFVGAARGTTAFRRLAAHLRSEYGLAVPSRDVTVVAAEDPEGTRHHVVSFTPMPTGRTDADGRSYDLVVALRGSEAVAAGASIVEYDGDVPTTVTIVEYDDGGVDTSTHALDLDDLATPDAEAESDGVTVQQTDCEICRSIFEVACSVGCGIGGLALCTLAGITTFGVASIACGAIGTAVCYFVGEYGCDPGAETACSELNYC